MKFVEHDPDPGNSEHKAPLLVMPAARPQISRWELWRRRLFLVEFVFVCLLIGAVLIVTPWTPYWSNNSLLVGWPRVQQFMMNDFVRGLVSGLGLVDICLAIREAVCYREHTE